MTWSEVHEELIKKLLKRGYAMPHGCGPNPCTKYDCHSSYVNGGIVPGHDCAPRLCVWIIKAPKPHVSFVNDVAEVSEWYDDHNGVKISLTDPKSFEKIENEIWQEHKDL